MPGSVRGHSRSSLIIFYPEVANFLRLPAGRRPRRVVGLLLVRGRGVEQVWPLGLKAGAAALR